MTQFHIRSSTLALMLCVVVAAPGGAQVTDAVTQANVRVLSDAPSLSVGNLYQQTSQAASGIPIAPCVGELENCGYDAPSTVATPVLFVPASEQPPGSTYF